MEPLITKSVKGTQKIARELGSALQPGQVVALVGDLGAGKTSFVQGLAEGLKIHDFYFQVLVLTMRSKQTLTPALSLSERERVNHSAALAKSLIVDSVERARKLLPLPGGEGRGEPILLRHGYGLGFGDVHILQLGVSLHGGHAEVPAEAALFEAPERRLDVDAAMRIDAQHAAFDRPRDAERAAQIVGPEGGA